MANLDDLARKLESLAEVPQEAAAAAAPVIAKRIMAAGREGGPLRKGNAVALAVSAHGTKISITRVYPYGPNVNALASSIEDAVGAAFKKRLEQ